MAKRNSLENPQADLSVGDIAAATGLSPDTIRVWERRYGRPVPVRLDSGHRRYTQAQVRWLRRVSEALARGHRPAVAVRADEEELTRLLQDGSAGAEDGELSKLLESVRGYRKKELLARFEKEWTAFGAERFLEERVAPLLYAVGRAWADGRLDVRNEHFVAELLEDFLREKRATFTPKRGQPLMILTTLPGEQHGLGVQMASVVCAKRGWRLHVLGPETPVSEILAAVTETEAAAVSISVSLATGGIDTDRVLAELKETLPDDVALLVGGSGARGPRRGPRGVTYVESLRDLGGWLDRD